MSDAIFFVRTQPRALAEYIPRASPSIARMISLNASESVRTLSERGVFLFHECTLTARALLRDVAGSLYHILVALLSAGIALLLPAGATKFLAFWSQIESDKLSLIALELTVAMMLILGLNYLRRSIRDHALASVATGAGLVSYFPRRARGAQQRIKQLKEEHGVGRTIMVIGSSGYSTLVDQVGDLSSVLDKCLGAKILLVNPYSYDATTRIQAIGHPEHPLATFREEVRQSIELLRRLKAMGKAINLKLYADPPLVKMVILGDYLWLQHYHAALDVQTMPEYVLRHNPKDHGFYTLYAHYFSLRWESPEIPEYDFDTDELVYRTKLGHEIRRERYGIDRPSTAKAVTGQVPEGLSDPVSLAAAGQLGSLAA